VVVGVTAVKDGEGELKYCSIIIVSTVNQSNFFKEVIKEEVRKITI